MTMASFSGTFSGSSRSGKADIGYCVAAQVGSRVLFRKMLTIHRFKVLGMTDTIGWNLTQKPVAPNVFTVNF